MKVHSKMMVSSSPGRPEKLVAPQFTKLLRGKGGSLSRGRSLSQSRSSPIFVTRRRSCNGSSSAVEIPDGKDPGSPKVTCMGQVRIKKKKKKKTMKKLGTSASSSSMSSKKQERNRGNQQCCRCLNGSALFWNPFSTGKSTVTPPPSSPSMLRRWISSSCFWSYQKPMQKGEDSGGDDFVISLDRFGSTTGGNESVQQPEDAEEKEPVVAAAVEEKEAFVPTTPPKNALLLMRCRSAPHHSSPLITAFSAQKEIDTIGEITGKNKGTDSREAPGDGDKENNSINLKNKEVGTAPSSDENLRSEEDDDEEEEASMAAIGPIPSFSSRPLILTRCKSEPAKKTASLPPAETNGSCFWTISSNTGNSSSGKNNRSTPSS